MRKRWIIILPILAAISIAYCFRETLAVQLFPKAVLTRAIGNVFEDMEARFENSPLTLIAGALDPNGCHKLTLKLDTATAYTGIAHYDLEAQTQADPNRVSAQGTLSTEAGLIDLNLYMDQEFAALASQTLTDGAWYGIHFESFSDDIRGFQLLELLLDDEILTGWDKNVSEFASFMGNNYSLPELDTQDLQAALLGTMALQPTVEAEEDKHCHRITFTAKGAELAQKVQPYLVHAPEYLVKLVHTMGSDRNSEIRLIFHLKNLQLTGLDASLTFSGQSYDGSFSIKGSQLSCDVTQWSPEKPDRWVLLVDTASDENSYQEKIVFTQTASSFQNQFSAEYSWDISTGDMALEVVKDGKNYPVRLNLKGEGQHISLSCQQFDQILNLLTGKAKSQSIICNLTVSPGQPVLPVAYYKSLSDWSTEDLFLLLTRLGGLAGITLP